MYALVHVCIAFGIRRTPEELEALVLHYLVGGMSRVEIKSMMGAFVTADFVDNIFESFRARKSAEANDPKAESHTSQGTMHHKSE